MSYANPLLIKSFAAGAATSPFRIVKFGADDRHVIQATAATDGLLGVTNELPANAAEQLADVILQGIAEVELGGTVALTDKVTADSVGRGVAAAPATGVNNRVIGLPLIAGVSGDIIPVLLAQSVLQG